MKNKLLISTALGAVMLSGAVNAETKITGQVDINYSAQSSSTAASSKAGFGKEAQINVSNSGELNNGLSYAAGFSWEADGNSPSNDENFYIDFISGNTTVGVSQDHGLNTDSSAVPRVSINAGSLSTFDNLAYAQGSQVGSHTTNGATGATHVKEGWGVTLAQKFDAGTIQARWTPEFGQDGGSNDAIAEANEGSAYDLNFQGNLGMEGLSVNLAYAKVEKAAGSTHTSNRDSKGVQYGVGYNFGQFAIGIQRADREMGDQAVDRDTKEIGATFAATETLSLGAAYAETDVTGTASNEEITQVSIGYNMGAVAVHLNYADYQNVKGVTNADEEVGSIRFTTKF